MDLFKIFRRNAPTKGGVADQTNNPGSGATDLSSGIISYNYVQLGMVWTMLAGVLGVKGIYPVFKGPKSAEHLRNWESYVPDAAGKLNVKQLQRLFVCTMTLEGEVFVWRPTRDTLLIMPQVGPDSIEYNENRIPISYSWPEISNPIPADQVDHYYMPLRPGQKRGYAQYKVVAPAAECAKNYPNILVRFAILASRLNVLRKRNVARANDTLTQSDSIMLSETETTALWDVGKTDEFETLNQQRLPVSSDELTRLIATITARAYGLSRLITSGDYGDVNYSSARFASQNDAIVFAILGDDVELFTSRIFEKWTKVSAKRDFTGNWQRPIRQAIDPVKQAASNKILVELGAKSRKQVSRELDLDPEVMEREIREERSNVNVDMV